jgi:hypothetical protein
VRSRICGYPPPPAGLQAFCVPNGPRSRRLVRCEEIAIDPPMWGGADQLCKNMNET